jgi:hypothetical protein
MVTERLRVKVAVDGACTDINKNVGSQSTRWLKCGPCRDEMVGMALVLDQVRSSQTGKNSTAECVLGPEVSLARTPNFSDVKAVVCYHTLTIKECCSGLDEAHDM